MDLDKEQVKRLFPNLSRELKTNKQKVVIDSLRTDKDAAEKAAQAQKNLANYDPDIIDFLRRCDDRKQAEEIIAYMENRGEISRSYAHKLRQQLQKKGIRSFGPKKEEGYYFKVTKE